MIKNLQVINSQDVNPYFNLGLEEFLVNHVAQETAILYLWQNENTVVIGRNQNAWKECRFQDLATDNGHVARRLSGGGAVYHDLGNLNFTFITSMAEYDVKRQTNVIIRALKKFGLEAYHSGRNDLLIDGRKFSGNAYYRSNLNAYHHGTLLVDVDMHKLSRYLKVSLEKLRSNSVKSVKSRVVNLAELNPAITIETLRQSLIEAFQEEYSKTSKPFILSQENIQDLQLLTQKYSSKEWIFQKKITADFEIMERFAWGDFHLAVVLEGDYVKECVIYSDAMDVNMIKLVEEIVLESKFSVKKITNTLEKLKTPYNEQMLLDIQVLLCSNAL